MTRGRDQEHVGVAELLGAPALALEDVEDLDAGVVEQRVDAAQVELGVERDRGADQAGHQGVPSCTMGFAESRPCRLTDGTALSFAPVGGRSTNQTFPLSAA